MSRALLALLITLAAAPAAAARDAMGALDGCIARLDPARDVGYDRIAARCPDLAPSLTQSPWAAWLPRDWDRRGNDLSVRGLEELRALIAAESRRAAGAHAPLAAHVAAVLASLAPAPAHGGWWQRLKAWLRELLTARGQTPAGGGWAAQLIAALRTSWVRLASFGALALVALLAAAIVVRELRATGLLRLGRRAAPAGVAGASDMHAANRQCIDAAPPAERPRLLLELIAARLAALERLPPVRALTVHELLRAARLADAADRARLAELAGACERLRFSGRRLPPETLTAAIARGRELLDGLEPVRA